MVERSGPNEFESFAQGQYNPSSQNFGRVSGKVFSPWESDQHFKENLELRKENDILRRKTVGGNFGDGQPFEDAPELNEEDQPKGLLSWFQKKPLSTWDTFSCSVCNRLIKDVDEGDLYYICEKYCKKVYCSGCQFKARQEFMQHPQLAVQKMAYYKNFEKIHDSFKAEQENKGCSIF